MSDELLNNSNNLLEMSDEEIMNMDLDALTSSAEAEEADEASEADSGDVVEEPTTAETESEDNGLSEPDDVIDDVSDSSVTDDVVDAPEVEEPQQDAFDGEEEAEEVESTEEAADDADDGIDYKAEYLKLTAPFKANGKEIKIDSVDEAIQLMQMGANYNKKMSALKPNLKLLKMLENNSLLDESKLNYLIDLDKRNPEAIKHLLKDSGIDPLELDTSEQTSYKPQSYTVNDREVELDSVLEEIQDTPTYSKTIDVVSNKWDAASRKIIVEHPALIKLINEHMSNGIYAQIESVMEKERMLGRLNGMSDLEAYRQIGDRIFASGGSQPSTEQPQPVKSTPKPKTDPKIASRKKAAAPTKSAPTSKAKEDFNPLSMSDDEFDKLISSKFL